MENAVLERVQSRIQKTILEITKIGGIPTREKRVDLT
jgi:hypothetical protein